MKICSLYLYQAFEDRDKDKAEKDNKMEIEICSLYFCQAFEEWGDWPEDEEWKDDKDTPVRNKFNI